MFPSSSTSPLGRMKLPACERCRIHKVKCDTQPPKCAACKRSNSGCIILDPVTNERYTRDGLAEMEHKLELLEKSVKAPSVASSALSPSDAGNQRGMKRHFVGDGSGLHFFQRLSKAAKTRLPLSDESPTAVHRSPYGSSAVAPHPLPSSETATLLVTVYLSHVQLHHPLLAQCTLTDLARKVYDPNNGQISAEDMYRLFMVFAISSITAYRRGQTQEHPYGYFSAAQRYASEVSMAGSIEGIQNLLLVARFAMYYHIDCSIWDIARFCMRQCIALGLHRPPTKLVSPLEEQIQRNVFWDCYVHDRYSSGILGRPYAIAEDDITVELPVEVREESLVSSRSNSLNDLRPESQNLPNEASVFRFVIKLRRIITNISTCFYSSRGHAQHPRRNIADAGRVRSDLYRFLEELRCAREHAPAFPEPRSLYERSEWYDFLVEKDKLTLIRGALAQMPVDGLHPPRGLLEMCSHCATSVIELYSTMFSRGHITWTRSYFQIMFTTGLSIMYAMSILRHEKAFQTSEQKDMFARASRALISASDLMKMFVSEMPDAGHFAVVFEVLVKQHTGTGTRTRPSRAANPPARDHTGQPFNPSETPYTQHDAVPMQSLPPQDGSLDAYSATLVGAGLQPALNPQVAPDQGEYEFTLELGPDDFQNWSLFPTNTDTVLGQMEADLGEYAWGMPPDDSLWDQWGAFRGHS